MKELRLIFIILISFFGIIYLIYVSYIYFNQAAMVFVASKLPKEYKFDFSQNFEEKTITSFDGAKLNGLLFKVSNPKGLIFYLHGNAGSIDSWGNNAKIYTDLDYDIFFLDYRGYGKSEGQIENQKQIYKDITYAYANLISKYDKNKTIIIGYSIGTGLATYLASIEQPKMLILQAPYYNFTEFTKTRVPFFPDFLKKFSFETNKYIAGVKSPIYIFHGNNDELIPIENSFRLQRLMKPTDSLYKLENQGHLGMNENVDYQNKLQILLKSN